MATNALSIFTGCNYLWLIELASKEEARRIHLYGNWRCGLGRERQRVGYNIYNKGIARYKSGKGISG
jgi:hypothetical protein